MKWHFPGLAALSLAAMGACQDGAPETAATNGAAADAGGSSAPVAGDPDTPISSGPLKPGLIAPAMDPATPDPCGAERYRSLIGKHRSAIPEPPPGAIWRIACSTCALTEDYSPRRMTVIYVSGSGRVTELRCG